jgi:prepilin-type N-terminal cleavage/methylation domain-containing protein
MQSNRNPARHTLAARAFTLIELLVVVAIIALLIGILVPSLGAARAQAKNVKTRATLKALGDGLEMFRGDNDKEQKKTGGYPPSAEADDPTETGQQYIFGAQWLVRYLVGKDAKGYIPKRNVPPGVLAQGTPGFEQKGWYDDPNVPRSGLYVQADGLKLVQPKNLKKAPASAPMNCDDKTLEQVVATDAFDFPILYYAANARLSDKSDAPIAIMRTDPNSSGGIYTMADNGMFTGACQGTTCFYNPWDFAGMLGSDGADTDHRYPLSQFGDTNPPTVASLKADVDAGKVNFSTFILNRNGFMATNEKSASPFRRDSFILITAGKDGIYGTKDDVTNFQ